MLDIQIENCKLPLLDWSLIIYKALLKIILLVYS